MTIDLYEHVEQFGHRLVQDALTHALADYWERRASALEAAMPRPGDYLGHAGVEAVRDRADDLASKATACRSHARLMLGGDLA